MPATMREGGRLVVVGGDAAGMSAASRARRMRPDIEIVVLEKSHDVSYSACAMPYYIGGVVGSRSDLIARTVESFRTERRIDVRLGAEAVELDCRRRRVRYLAAGTTEWVEYDSLVIATGARPVRPPLPGVELDGIFVLRALTDGDAIKAFVDSGGVERAVVVGGGYVGLEVAEALVMRGAEVTVVELLSTVLSSYDADMSAVVEKELLAKGVILRKDARVEGFEPASDGARVGYVVVGAQRLRTDMVVLASGVRPETSLAETGGIELGPTGAIRVDARQVTSEPAVLAAGDCCEATHVVTGKQVWIPLGTTANKQGRIAGHNAVGGSEKFSGVAGTNVTKIFDLEVAQTGLSEVGAERVGIPHEAVRITALSRAHSYPGGSPLVVKLVFESGTGRLLGAQMVGREGAAKRIDVVATAIYAGMSVGDLARVDMSYAPPFAPVWDPVLVAAGQAVKRLRS